MASDAYLKSAASEIRRAAQARKQETDKLRQEIAHKEEAQNKLVNDLDRQKKEAQLHARMTDSDATRNLKFSESRQLDQKVRDEQRRLDAEKSAKLAEINAKQNDVQDLMQMASQVESKA